jgi:gamma-glutamyltranspeptidase/glutathione hydrolase
MVCLYKKRKDLMSAVQNSRHSLWIGLIALLLFASLLSACSHSQGPVRTETTHHFDPFFHQKLFPDGRNRYGREARSYFEQSQQAMVSGEHPLAVQIAKEVLQKGGNAVDAAVAMSFALSVVKPQSTGIGGGGFLLYYDADKKKTYAIDMREMAPGKAHEDMYVREGKADTDASLRGALSAAVPGLVSGLEFAHKRFGSDALSWKELVEPSIEKAQRGFWVDQSLARSIQRIQKAGLLERFPETRRLLSKKGGQLYEARQLWKNPEKAKTLRLIAEKGSKGFYEGEVAKGIIATMKKHGGIITLEDLTNYKPKMREPVFGTYRGHQIASFPPPSSGGIHLIQMLNMLENFELKTFDFASPETLHLKVETMRRAYADRSKYLGDSDFYDVPVKALISKSYARKRANQIKASKASRSESAQGKAGVKPGNLDPFKKEHTTHFSIVDAGGNVVASTQTINYTFGSALVVDGFGFFLNDEMDDFSIQPGVPNVFGLVGGEANKIEPGKRPLSSMTPTIVFKDGEPILSLGSPGGSRIINSVYQVISNRIDHEMTPTESVFAPRIHHQWLPDKLFVEEYSLLPESQEALKEMGHRVEVMKDRYIGNVSAIFIDLENQRITGVADPRHYGEADGF